MTNNELTNEIGFVWFQGVVEDRQDPLQLGRCRVRCLGFHSEDKNQLPTEDLPWAHPMQSITSAAMNGIGQSPTGMVEGTWVIGFFRDGMEAQQPIIMGTIGGIPEELTDPNSGFSDPNAVYPKEEFLGEPDTNRLSRGVTEGTITQTKLENLDKMELPTTTGELSTVQEPYYDTKSLYPYNHTIQTESGHVIELDDTVGMERIHIHHKSGTSLEILPDGTMIRRTGGEGSPIGGYSVTVGDEYIHAKGNYNITVDGHANIYTKGDSYTKTDGTHRMDVDGDLDINVKGKIDMTAGEGSSKFIMENDGMRLIDGQGINLREDRIKEVLQVMMKIN